MARWHEVSSDPVIARDDGLPRALWWDAEASALMLLDQTQLPLRVVVLTCPTVEAVAEAIRTLRVRGAPAIGVAAAYGIVLGAREIVARGGPALEPGDAMPELHAIAELSAMGELLKATRPTAVNLAWAVDRVLYVVHAALSSGMPVERMPERALAEAHAIAQEDAAACQAMGELGAELIADGDALLTHCNAGALATAGIGTALAPIYVAHRAGKRVHVFVDETRPVLQGARLTAWELHAAGVPLTLITDNMAAHVMRTRGIRGVFVGADRIAANGDVANKIGTYGVALLAHAHGIPFYVVAPRSTLDLALASGAQIPIEERAATEVTHIGEAQLAPEGVAAANPAFDVTPARYVTAIITEVGIARPPYSESLARVMGEGLTP